MCFAPKRRALFRRRNFSKGSEAEVFCIFWFRIVFRTTTACNFPSLIWPDGSAPAALASLLFDPPEPQIIGKTSYLFAIFLPFRASASSFFWLFLFSDLLSSIRLCSLTLSISAFHSSILSTSKLPSMMYCYLMSCYVMYFCVVYWYVIYSWVLCCSVISSYAVYCCMIYCYMMW